MNKIITYAAVLVIGILIGSSAFYGWIQISSSEDTRNAAYTQYGETDAMNYRAFLRVGEISGSSRDELHPDEIEILEYSWGETVDADSIFLAMGAVKPAKEDFAFVFWIDRQACPELYELCTKGEIIEEAVFSIHPLEGSYDFLVVTLREVVVSSFQIKGNVFEGSEPLCEISLAFKLMKVQTVTREGSYDFAWDFEANQEP
jgi:type VI secretion system secreted protein Hcp